jgi:hypothetical protein
MLPDHVLELLTAFVDGELSQRQRKAVMRLLGKSSEAREVLKQLQENAHALKQLPYHKVEPSLVEEVLKAIAEEQALPKPSAPRRRPWLPYVAASLAAGLMIGLIGVLYWSTVNAPQPFVTKDSSGIAKNDDKKVEPLPIPNPPRRQEDPRLAALTQGTFNGFATPYVAPKPYEAKFGDLVKGESKAASEFTHILNVNRNKSVRLEVTVNNSEIAVTRLREVLNYREIKLVTDPAVSKALKGKAPAKMEFLVYAENITPDELTKLMRELGHQYVVGLGTNQKMVNSPYQKVAVAPSETEDRQKVAKLLGVESIEPKSKEKPNPKAKRQVILLPLNGAGVASPEAKQFLQQRTALQPNTLQVILRIRSE